MLGVAIEQNVRLMCEGGYINI